MYHLGEFISGLATIEMFSACHLKNMTHVLYLPSSF